ncbi:MAG: hypothetical protein J2P48_18075 [Alphaproteobacteria bacterium]|nr:hypothetical protein [Alphaproteobacteria bacterium]
MRTGLSGEIEHFVAYAGPINRDGGLSAEPGCHRDLGAGTLESLPHFSPGRPPSTVDFAESALGGLCGGLVIAPFSRRLCDDG